MEIPRSAGGECASMSGMAEALGEPPPASGGIWKRLGWKGPFLALPLLALLCALVANALASPRRRLAWTGSPPERPVGVALTPALPPALVPGPAEAGPLLPQPAAPPSASPLKPAALQARVQPSAPAAAAVPEAPDPAARALARFPVPEPGTLPELSLAEGLEAHRLGVPFLDARRTAEYLEGHIAGAYSAPVWEELLRERLVRFDAAGHPSRGPLVLYCSGGGCEDSHLLATRLLAMGYRNLRILKEGFPDWAAQGGPVAKGERP